MVSAVRQTISPHARLLTKGAPISAVLDLNGTRGVVHYEPTAHPRSADRARRTMSAYGLVTSLRPNLTDMIASLGELVVADCPGAKANCGENSYPRAHYPETDSISLGAVSPQWRMHLNRTRSPCQTPVSRPLTSRPHPFRPPDRVPPEEAGQPSRLPGSRRPALRMSGPCLAARE